ncbi:hypothetical protein [Acetivibrio clariflavus]|uniref:Uncharacterized protein n=1 Tax=Acetivibrio clariflavus (strain DSM 19732 / NBRC 101661 / EBR45) TaxID=720554 RepID=G8LVZ0_ACECE|nr:hypothetical protein [Acetivibrio clariflavus]AEV68594.1 hypothetical protein Clocl_1995 [Acetivibrio clariflavus DSM 19732]HOP99919.1 hypothetical protein [Acetivibrio clariflavus]HPU40987.1 hypothetical protein [Acetivibrio clariflavus]
MEEPVCGTMLRLENYKNKFFRYLDNVINDIEKKELAAWYLSLGNSSKVMKEWLIDSLKADEELYNIAKQLTEQANGRSSGNDS